MRDAPRGYSCSAENRLRGFREPYCQHRQNGFTASAHQQGDNEKDCFAGTLEILAKTVQNRVYSKLHSLGILESVNLGFYILFISHMHAGFNPKMQTRRKYDACSIYSREHA